ncbi:pilin [Suttonella ornithocola]|uniref:Tfp pilus assembly protein, major pilin PilA n=1 Tax=Suttonella ornithocola TaxID=279832 RepID=A0A380MMF8_9GAMM|nr:hypothetical protein [Suttonella ornithocola]SUO93800.1 Tfp pilus assembly protein, major pilin PilA [Suttonella ornithocola]
MRLKIALYTCLLATAGISTLSHGQNLIDNLLGTNTPAFYYPEEKDSLWLINRLPPKTESYLRIPSVASFSLANGYGLPKPVAQAFHEQYPEVAKQIAKDFSQANALLLAYLKASSPVEVAIQNAISSRPQLILSAEFADAKATLEELKQNHKIQLRSVDDNQGQIRLANVPLVGEYLVQGNRITVMLSTQKMKMDWQWAMQDAANNIDHNSILAQAKSNNTRTLIWQKNLARLSAMLTYDKPFTKPLQISQIQGIGILTQQTPDLYRAKLAIDMPNVGLRELFPVEPQPITLTSYGEPDFVLLYTLPTVEQATKILRLFDKDYDAIKQSVAQKYHIDLDLLLKAISGQHILLSDDFGKIIASPKAKLAAWEAVIDAYKKNNQILVDETDKFGIRHVAYKITFPEQQKNPANLAFLKAMMPVPQEIYFKVEGDYLLQASLPQPLIARQQSVENHSLSEYFKKAGIDPKRSSFAFLTNVKNLSMQHYYQNLSYLQLLSNYTGKAVNLSDYPAVSSLKLPASEWLSFQINNAQNEPLNFTLTSPHNLMDWSYKGNTTTVIASVGILAAIAIPAYQDYVVRTQVANIYTQTQSLRDTVVKTGKLPVFKQYPEAFLPFFSNGYMQNKTIWLKLAATQQTPKVLEDHWLALTRTELGKWNCNFYQRPGGTPIYQRFLPNNCQ